MIVFLLTILTAQNFAENIFKCERIMNMKNDSRQKIDQKMPQVQSIERKNIQNMLNIWLQQIRQHPFANKIKWNIDVDPI